MARLNATRGSQYPLVAELVLNLATDSVVDINGVTRDLKTFGTAIVFDAILLPPKAVVLSGAVTTEVAASGSTAVNVVVGDSAVANRYLASTDKVAAGRTALVPTGYVSLGEQVRVSITPTVADATAGTISIRVEYAIRDRVNETQTH